MDGHGRYSIECRRFLFIKIHDEFLLLILLLVRLIFVFVHLVCDVDSLESGMKAILVVINYYER